MSEASPIICGFPMCHLYNDLKNQIKDAPGNTMPRRILSARALPTTAAISPKQGCQTCAEAFWASIQTSLSPGRLPLDLSLSLVLLLCVSKEPCASTLAGTSKNEVQLPIFLPSLPAGCELPEGRIYAHPLVYFQHLTESGGPQSWGCRVRHH